VQNVQLNKIVDNLAMQTKQKAYGIAFRTLVKEMLNSPLSAPLSTHMRQNFNMSFHKGDL
jgi:Arc/MetJ family transcription regulator